MSSVDHTDNHCSCVSTNAIHCHSVNAMTPQAFADTASSGQRRAFSRLRSQYGWGSLATSRSRVRGPSWLHVADHHQYPDIERERDRWNRTCYIFVDLTGTPALVCKVEGTLGLRCAVCEGASPVSHVSSHRLDDSAAGLGLVWLCSAVV